MYQSFTTKTIFRPGTEFEIDDKKYTTVGVCATGGYLSHDYKSVLTVDCEGSILTACFTPSRGVTSTFSDKVMHSNMNGWVLKELRDV